MAAPTISDLKEVSALVSQIEAVQAKTKTLLEEKEATQQGFEQALEGERKNAEQEATAKVEQDKVNRDIEALRSKEQEILASAAQSINSELDTYFASSNYTGLISSVISSLGSGVVIEATSDMVSSLPSGVDYKEVSGKSSLVVTSDYKVYDLSPAAISQVVSAKVLARAVSN